MLCKPAACVLSPARSPARPLSLTRMHACLIELRFMHACRAFAAEGRNGHGRGVCRLPQRAVGAARWRGEGTWRQVCARDAAAHRAHAIAHGAVSMLMARVSRVVLRMRWFARARSCVRACSKRGAACGSANASAWATTWYSQVGSAAVPRRAPVVGAAARVRAGEAHQRADVPCESAGVARADAAAVRFGRQQFWRRRKKPWLGHWQRQTVNANSLSPIEQCLSANWFNLVVDSSNTRQTRTRFERI